MVVYYWLNYHLFLGGEMARTTKEVRIEARVRNNVLWHVIHDQCPTIAAFCRAQGNLSQAEVGALLNLKTSPLNRKGQYRNLCKRLAEISFLSCEELFPLYLYGFVRTNIALEVSLSSLPRGGHNLVALESADDQTIRNERTKLIEQALSTLTPREQFVLRAHFGLDNDKEWTTEETRLRIGVTKEVFKQLEAKALKKLRHPTRARLLKDCLD